MKTLRLRKPIHFLRLAYALGLLGSLLVWALPLSLKPYHILRVLDDYQQNLVERASEWGFDSDGLVKVYYTHQFGGGTQAAIDRIRDDWHSQIECSHDRWPTDSSKLHYDEWGPSNWDRADGVHEIECGKVACVPYSCIAAVCALPLLWWGLSSSFRNLRKWATRQNPTLLSIKPDIM